jgi:hypothetical protein
MGKGDLSLDLAGIGKLAKAIPGEAWDKLVKTACDTFQQLVAPITSLTGGAGRLIQAKFDRLVDAEKIIVASNLAKAHEKAEKAPKRRRRKSPPSPSFITRLISESSAETDKTLRELWTNLLANEIARGDVHPEFIRILSRLSARDAHRLAEIAEREQQGSRFSRFIKALGSKPEPIEFTEVHLELVGLIVWVEPPGLSGLWKLSVIGEAFINAVSEPICDE